MENTSILPVLLRMSFRISAMTITVALYAWKWVLSYALFKFEMN